MQAQAKSYMHVLYLISLWRSRSESGSFLREKLVHVGWQSWRVRSSSFRRWPSSKHIGTVLQKTLAARADVANTVVSALPACRRRALSVVLTDILPPMQECCNGVREGMDSQGTPSTPIEKRKTAGLNEEGIIGLWQHVVFVKA